MKDSSAEDKCLETLEGNMFPFDIAMKELKQEGLNAGMHIPRKRFIRKAILNWYREDRVRRSPPSCLPPRLVQSLKLTSYIENVSC